MVATHQEEQIRFSVGLPTGMEGLMYPVPFATPAQIVEIAQYAEYLGYDSVWGNDHMTTQAYVRSEFSEPTNYWEVLTTLALIASKTQRLKLGTGILVPAMRRDIVVLAKQIATLDHFSQGRLTIGMGVGAYREEFEALHPNFKAHRGKLMVEAIQALRLLFEKRTATFEGDYFHFEDVEMYPKPLQEPLPIYIGGNNANALQRTAQYGQGWLAGGMPVDQMRDAVNNLKAQAENFGRDPESIEIAPQFCACIDKTHTKAVERFKSSQMFQHLLSLSGTTLKDQVGSGYPFEEIDLVGTPDEIIEKIIEFKNVGVQHACGILFTASSVSELREQMHMFAESVMDIINPS